METIPKLLVGQVVELKKLTYDIRIFLNNENTIKEVMSMIESGDKLMKVWDHTGKIIWENL
jgi:hypothetical protein